MAAGGEGGAVQDEVGGVLRYGEAQLTGGVAGGCAIHPATKPRGVSLQAITASQHSNSEVGSGGGLLIVQDGGPVVGWFTEGEVAVANRKVWAHFSEGDVMIDVQQPFVRLFPGGFAPWVRD